MPPNCRLPSFAELERSLDEMSAAEFPVATLSTSPLRPAGHATRSFPGYDPLYAEFLAHAMEWTTSPRPLESTPPVIPNSSTNRPNIQQMSQPSPTLRPLQRINEYSLATEGLTLDLALVKRVNTETHSRCDWNGCGQFVDNSLVGLGNHLFSAHQVNVKKLKTVSCQWGVCRGLVYCGRSQFLMHIRGTHLRLEHLICPFCGVVTANGYYPFRRHVRKSHPSVQV
ncbi:hypothetical protein GALMADRAFT_231431 [Galerina marginata CBS 339.88]|uniref:C2H2-type domain-containing protein n=1 Tax=Galerina marginata (strain CBS 339.88) TaxID=685588 RepID=A0A067SB76_GALM3|nr:hypothetical protein GALMADRAFT_231431 [Galerina marginata CBS 339.88]